MGIFMQSANVTLSEQDIDYISRVVQTEVDHGLKKSDPAEYNRMIQATVDTIVNRMGSSSFPDKTTSVADQRNQFSGINGPKKYRDASGTLRRTGATGSVETSRKASDYISKAVKGHLEARERGAPSRIGNDTHFANPYTSSPNNVKSWIEPMSKLPGAQTFGKGQKIHIHSTDPNMLSGRTNTRVDVEGYESPNGHNPMAFSPEGRPSMRAGAKYIAPPIPKSRASALSAPVTPVQRASLAPLANSAQQAINSRFPSEQQIAASRPSPIQQASSGPSSRPNNRPTQSGLQTTNAPQGMFASRGPTTRPNNSTSSNDPWAMDAGIQNASYRAREAFGIGNGQSQPSRQQSASRSAPASNTGYTSSQFAGQPSRASSQPQYITKDVTERVPRSPAGGMTLDQASQFAYGPSSINFRQQNAAPPIPTAKPAPEYDTVTKQIQVANPNYRAPVPQMRQAAPPMPTAKPAEQKGFFGSIANAMGGMFSPAGTAGGLVGGALGGPLGSIAGNFAGRGLSNMVQNNPTFGNRGTTNSFGTGNNSGGPYAGQSWRDTAQGGTRVFNPSSRQYEDIGGENAGNRSGSQQTGSGGGFFSSLFG